MLRDTSSAGRCPTRYLLRRSRSVYPRPIVGPAAGSPAPLPTVEVLAVAHRVCALTAGRSPYTAPFFVLYLNTLYNASSQMQPLSIRPKTDPHTITPHYFQINRTPPHYQIFIGASIPAKETATVGWPRTGIPIFRRAVRIYALQMLRHVCCIFCATPFVFRARVRTYPQRLERCSSRSQRELMNTGPVSHLLAGAV